MVFGLGKMEYFMGSQNSMNIGLIELTAGSSQSLVGFASGFLRPIYGKVYG